MQFPHVTSMATCLLFAIAASGIAQTDSSTNTRSSAYTKSLSLTSAFTSANRIDAAASPRTFDGSGLAGTIGFRSNSDRWMTQASLEGSHALYKPSTGEASVANERAIGGRLGLGVTRWITSRPKRAIGAGLSLNSWGEVLSHRYDDPNATTASFVTGFATVGPSLTWRESLANGDASLTATAPLAGWVHQPYADARQERDGVTLRSIGPTQLRGLDVALRYETSANSRLGIVAEHRVRGFEYSGGWTVRSLTNATSLGMVVRFGRRPQ